MKARLSSTPLHMLVAFMAMGAWAAWANHDHATAQMWRAALLQGALSALLTLYLKRVVEAINQHYEGATALWLPPLVAVTGSAALLVALHLVAGTPAIVATVAVPLLVSSSYVSLYNLTLVRNRRHSRGKSFDEER